MEEILDKWVRRIRRYLYGARTVEEALAPAKEDWLAANRWAGYSWTSVRAAVISQFNAAYGGQVFEQMTGAARLPRYDYGFNPSLPHAYRYTLLARCQGVEGGPEGTFSFTLNPDTALDRAGVAREADKVIKKLKEDEYQIKTLGLPLDPFAICTTEILYAERRSR